MQILPLCRRGSPIPYRPTQLTMPATNNTMTQAYMQKAKGHPGVYCVALNCPNSKNALSKQLLRELKEAITFAAKNPS